MARRAAVSIEKLTELDIEQLAQLVLEEAEQLCKRNMAERQASGRRLSEKKQEAF